MTKIMGKYHLRPDEAAKALNVSKRTIYRLLESGELVAFRVRGSLRIPSKEVKRFIDLGIKKFQEDRDFL